MASALAIGGVMVLLNNAWGFGTKELAAPQATLMKMIVEGVMNGNLPWSLIFIGVFIAVVFEIMGMPVLPVAIGLYLPLELSSTIMIGGLVRWITDRISDEKDNESGAGGGILFCSGMIAGEGIVGILLAILAVLGLTDKMNLSSVVNGGTIGGLILLIALTALVFGAAGKTRK